MILYIFKTVICSALFLGAYYLLLEKEKMLRFNRAYLLLSIIFSFCIPLITFTTEIPVFPVTESVVMGQEVQIPTIASVTQDAPPVDLLPVILFFIYGTVTLFFLVRFCMNIYRISRLVKRNPSVSYGNARLVLIKENSMPYSFLHYIFVDEQEYKTGSIENEIFRHEMEHVKQRHSIDIVLIELITAFAWFNPLIYLYRKAIQLNHEFQADDAVVRSFQDPIAYQHLLLDKISRPVNLRIASPFNYITAKKRLVMITKHTTRKAAILKSLIVLAVISMAVFMFSSRVIAQSPAPMDETGMVFNNPVPSSDLSDTIPQTPPTIWDIKIPDGTKEGVSAEMLQEYQQIIDTYAKPDNKGLRNYDAIPTASKKRLLEIFNQMNKEQRLQQDIIFLPPLKPLEKKVPSEEEMKSFNDPDMYGVWIDGKKVNNTELDKYKNTDFSRFDISKLYGRAKINKRYKYQLNLMTTMYFNKSNEKLKNRQDEIVAIRYKKK